MAATSQASALVRVRPLLTKKPAIAGLFVSEARMVWKNRRHPAALLSLPALPAIRHPTA